MSKYVQYNSVKFAELSILIAALNKLGYTQIVQGTNIALQGWGNQGQVADVVIRKNVIKAHYGDVGFVKTDSGYVPCVDDIDIHSIHNGRFLPELQVAYKELAINQLAKTQHATTTRRVEGRKIKILVRF